MDVPVRVNHERMDAEPTAGSIMVVKISVVKEHGKRAKNASIDEYPSQLKQRCDVHPKKHQSIERNNPLVNSEGR